MSKRKTIEQYKEEVFNIVGDEYTILGTEYFSNKIKIETRHNLCGTVYSVKPNDFISKGRRCPACKFKNVKNNYNRTHEDFLKEVEQNHGDKLTILSEYTSRDETVFVRCNICNDEFEKRASYLIGVSGTTGCPSCANNKKHTIETFKDNLNSKYPNKFRVLGEYVNNRTKIKTLCLKCEHIWSPTPSNLMKGHGCPKCKRSKGEERIANWLDAHNIVYQEQYGEFKELKRGKGVLKFDFYIPLENGEFCLIEYDGELHFIPYNKTSGIKDLEEQKERDARKNKFCQDNSIDLLRIKYTEFDKIEEILENYFTL